MIIDMMNYPQSSRSNKCTRGDINDDDESLNSSLLSTCSSSFLGVTTNNDDERLQIRYCGIIKEVQAIFDNDKTDVDKLLQEPI